MKIVFDTDNASFDDVGLKKEISSILKDICKRVDFGQIEGRIRDLNGNTIGSWDLNQNTKKGRWKMKKIETYLPLFGGFYNTSWQFDDDSLIYDINEMRKENNLAFLDYDQIEVDYDSFENDIVENFIVELGKILDPYIDKIIFQKINHPKYYNFNNDTVDVIIDAKIGKIKKYIYENIDIFKDYLKRKYTSHDGFCSYFSNNFADWVEYTENFSNFKKDGHFLGSILDFILENENIKEFDLYYTITENLNGFDYVLNLEDVLKNDII